MASVARHQQAREESRAAFAAVMGREPSLCERQFAQATGLVESSYGYGWSGSGVGSNNIGAIVRPGHRCRPGFAPDPPCDPSNSFETGDQTAEGVGYRCCYKRYPSREAGWQDLIRTVYLSKIPSIGVDRTRVLARAKSCDWQGAVEQLRAEKYFALTLDKAIPRYERALREITTALGEPFPQATPWRTILIFGGIVAAAYAAYRYG